ncbi:MAG: hypothetical protein A3A51_03340 [Candidatus Levybacteria bacterium RIFCSPLOWO2_01_FULL_39_10]|nr:MAG: hypothetical protein A3A51_03340 [Candidatus Levybacteria bacterium RIFCSPLOWO2_01_FULL_39_10]
MTKFPSLKPREVEKILLQNGFSLKRQSGSHRIFYNSELNAVVVLPVHSREIPTGTLRSIVKQSRLSDDKFLKKR